ncbi:MAG: biopolymer transport protein ExbB [Planctomycetota bacterium]|jgi:biopolymer transport protein ExbB
MTTTLPSLPPPAASLDLQSLFDMLIDGGPLMIPIGICSVVALAFTVERWLRLATHSVGGKRFANQLTHRVQSSGARSGLDYCREHKSALSRILAAGLSKSEDGYSESERAAEDTGKREVKRLGTNLRPLVVVAMIAPLLGLLGTVWGMIEAFANIGEAGGLGKPEVLASGISQALVTTAAGLAVAIPTQAVYYYFRARIDKFARVAEDTQLELGRILFDGQGAL